MVFHLTLAASLFHFLALELNIKINVVLWPDTASCVVGGEYDRNLGSFQSLYTYMYIVFQS